jgi:predicted AAA+ superfamily ATPase
LQKLDKIIFFCYPVAANLFLADNIGSTVSANSIGNTLVNEGLLEESVRKTAPSSHTIQAYVGALLESYIFYEVKRFDIKGKEYLRTLGKYYIADIGLRNYLLGFRDRDTGHILENIVYFELLRRGYDVAIGKIDNAEIDFIATNAQEKLYVQVTESMTSENVRRRELAPLQKVRDNYEKMILSLDPGLETSFEGIRSRNLIDWLIAE